MKGRALAKVGVVLMVVLGALVPLKAKALPFEQTPEGFMGHLNNATWDGSSRYIFLNAYECKWDNQYMVECRFDYQETSPLGKKTCVNVLGRYFNEASKAPGSHRLYPEGIDNFAERENPGECSDWKEVAAELPKEKTPELAGNQSADKQDSLNPELIAVGGLVISLLAGVAGFAIGREFKGD